jgi:hypothetical protein
MAEFTLCPECLAPGVQEVSRPELVDLAAAAGVRLVRPRPRRRIAGYWWCDRCLTGGAYFEWTIQRRRA